MVLMMWMVVRNVFQEFGPQNFPQVKFAEGFLTQWWGFGAWPRISGGKARANYVVPVC